MIIVSEMEKVVWKFLLRKSRSLWTRYRKLKSQNRFLAVEGSALAYAIVDAVAPVKGAGNLVRVGAEMGAYIPVVRGV